MSPGTTRIRKKMSTATPSSVGIIRRSRFTMYLPMRSVPPLAERLLGEPHGVELLVQEVAGRDRPATHPRAVRDDAVPLERVEIVRFLVEKPLLELAHEPLALLRVDRPTLPGPRASGRGRGPPARALWCPPPSPASLPSWAGEGAKGVRETCPRAPAFTRAIRDGAGAPSGGWGAGVSAGRTRRSSNGFR